ncbi:MAG: hypothetical protein IKN04_20090 [Clostridia bacterium]|nr:hypothetical protein [Clostridia bacterium]
MKKTGRSPQSPSHRFPRLWTEKTTAPGFIPDLWCFDWPLELNKIVYLLHFHSFFLGTFHYSRSFPSLQAPFGKNPAISATLWVAFFPPI